MTRTASQKKRQENARIARIAAQLAVRDHKRNERAARRTPRTFRDPISMDNVPVERGVLLNRQLYDPVSLAEWLDRSRTLPHSRRTLTHDEIDMVRRKAISPTTRPGRRRRLPDHGAAMMDVVNALHALTRGDIAPRLDDGSLHARATVRVEGHEVTIYMHSANIQALVGVTFWYNFDNGMHLGHIGTSPHAADAVAAVLNDARRHVPESHDRRTWPAWTRR